MAAIYILVGFLMLAGLLGSFLPAIPGTPLIVLGALVYAFFTDFDTVGLKELLILGGISMLAFILDYTAGALGVKKFGGSWWGAVGALVGAVTGFFFGPLGLVLGPIVGALIGELLRGRQLRTSVRSAFGTIVGMLLGTVAKLSLALVMIGLFLWWVWRG
ncbi:MAG: DUF456 domain-containing protein [Vicinamibacteria bacterium]